MTLSHVINPCPYFATTVPCKCKLTVSTRNSILEAIENRVSRFKAGISSIETLGEFFEDLDGRFRGNNQLFLELQTIRENKSDFRMALAYGLFLVWLKVEVNQISGGECSINLFRRFSFFRILLGWSAKL